MLNTLTFDSLPGRVGRSRRRFCMKSNARDFPSSGRWSLRRTTSCSSCSVEKSSRRWTRINSSMRNSRLSESRRSNERRRVKLRTRLIRRMVSLSMGRKFNRRAMLSSESSSSSSSSASLPSPSGLKGAMHRSVTSPLNESDTYGRELLLFRFGFEPLPSPLLPAPFPADPLVCRLFREGCSRLSRED